MSKQSAILLILIVFLGALGALLYFYFTLNKPVQKPTTISTTTVTQDVYDPFGTNIVIDNNGNVLSTTTDTSNNIPETPALSQDRYRKITDDPISGYSLVNDSKNNRTNIHYILRANGNIYEAYDDSPELKRLSITTVPKVYESIWLPDGQRLIIRYLKDQTEKIETFSVKINPATTTLNEFEGGIDGNHLSENISGLAVNPLGDKIFYLTNGVDGAVGFTAKPNGLNKKIIFQSPLVEWLVSWPKEEIILLTTKPSAKVPGYIYSLDSKTGSLSKVLGNISGLTAKMSPEATEMLYSDSSRSTPRLYLYNIKSGESKALPWNTLPEKCTWSSVDPKIIYCAVPKIIPAGEYPDTWYQGLVNFDDNIWMLNTDTLASNQILNTEEEIGLNMDIIDLQIDKKDGFLYFINKNDLTFWSLNIK